MRVDELFAKSLVGKTVKYEYTSGKSLEGCVMSLRKVNGKIGLFEISIREMNEKVSTVVLFPEHNIELLS